MDAADAQAKTQAAKQPPEHAASSPPPLPPRGWLKHAFWAVAKWAYANVLVVVFAPWVIGQVFLDRFHITGLCLFVPTPLVALVLLGTALLAWLVTCRRAALAAALLAVLPVLVVATVENRWWTPRIEPPAGKTLRLVNWNLGGGRAGWHDPLVHLRAQKADIYVLSEAYSEIAVEALLDALGPEYHINRAHSLAVIARGTIVRPDKPRVSRRAYVFLCSIDGTPISVLVADLPSLPTINRAPFLRQVSHVAEQANPDLIVGDFNAPRRSVFLSLLPPGYAHAYHLAGSGWSYTWPAQLPLWAIDQCIVGSRIHATRYELVTTPLSDHRMQVLDFALRPTPPAQ